MNKKSIFATPRTPKYKTHLNAKIRSRKPGYCDYNYNVCVHEIEQPKNVQVLYQLITNKMHHITATFKNEILGVQITIPSAVKSSETYYGSYKRKIQRFYIQ